MAQPARKVAVIIVNWNTGECLANCLRSLATLPEREIIEEVVVIDNASSDRSVVKAKQVVAETQNRPAVRFVMNDHNVGFAAANNIGLERLEARGFSSHVLLLNPDTIALPGMIVGMSKVFNRLERVGIVGPKLLNKDRTLQRSVRKFPTGKEIVLFLLKLGSWVKEEAINYNQEQAVDQVMGAVFLIRHECLAQVGKLDAGFFVWFEEVDYCRRATNLGWQVWYTPNAEAVHLGGVSFGQVVGLKRNWRWQKSLVRYTRKHLSKPVLWAAYSMRVINVLLWLPAVLAGPKRKVKL